MIPIYEPSITELETKYVIRALSSNKISSQAGLVEEFENEFANKFGYKHAVAVNSGSTALFLLLQALGIKVTCRVAVPAYSFIAVANAVAQCGAEVVPIDCDYSYNINPEKLEEALKTKKLDVVIAVHTYGIPCDMANILRLKEQYGFLLIEDCCEAIGTKYDDQYVGTFGEGAVYSFFASKTITTGEGGMICTHLDKIADYCRSYRNYCKSKDNPYIHTGIGYNFRLTSLQAALGLAQLKRLRELLSKRKEQVYFYKNEIIERKGISILPQDGSSYWAFPIYVENPKALAQYLKQGGIETRGGFCPIPKQESYRSNTPCPISEQLYAHTLTLPLHYNLTQQDQAYVIDGINNYGNQN